MITLLVTDRIGSVRIRIIAATAVSVTTHCALQPSILILATVPTALSSRMHSTFSAFHRTLNRPCSYRLVK